MYWFFRLYLSIVTLQGCHHFCCAPKGPSHTQTHIHSLSDSFPTWIITQHWGAFSVRCSRFLLATHPTDLSVGCQMPKLEASRALPNAGVTVSPPFPLYKWHRRMQVRAKPSVSRAVNMRPDTPPQLLILHPWRWASFLGFSDVLVQDGTGNGTEACGSWIAVSAKVSQVNSRKFRGYISEYVFSP